MRFACLLLALALVVTVASARDWSNALSELVATNDRATGERLISEIIEAGPDCSEVDSFLSDMEFPAADVKGEPVIRTSACIDSVERPWVLFVPESYDPARPTPLLLVLHGGVSRTELIEDPLAYVREDELLDVAAAEGYIVAFPLGQLGATWWDEVGMANIRSIVREIKSGHNVDDDRVWMAGFSDGASAGFLFAMVEPTDYAAFVALNGHIGVGSLDGNLPTYAPNLANTPVYATTTYDDQLYPSARMRPTIEMARAAGGDIFYRELPGTHDFADVEGELPGIVRFMERHPRDAMSPRVVWEAASPEFGRCKWLAIDAVTTAEAEPWHTDHNVALVDDRVSVGFYPAWDFEGQGVLVDALADGETAASNAGLRPGDVIVAADGARVDSLSGLDRWKAGISRGDAFEMTVLRDGQRVELAGHMPDATNYFVFKREAPSAKAVASFCANTVDIQASRVGALRLFVHPDMVRLGQNLTVRVNGDVVYDALVHPDLAYMLRNYLENKDRRLLYVAEVPLDLS